MKVLFIGDIVGRPGRIAVKNLLPKLKEEYRLELIIANAENAAGGNGITRQIANDLYDYGVDFLTMGNHVWDKKDILEFIDFEKRIIRPANFPKSTPGKGYSIIKKNDVEIGIMNLQGRVFMQPIDCPFRAADFLIDKIKLHTDLIIVDFHAEATSEKVAMGWYLDGRVSAVIGTHTHIQTADERILPQGTAYITDVGMTGPSESILGVKKENIITRFLTQMPNRFEVATEIPQLNAIILELNKNNGKTKKIKRIYQKYQ